MGRYVIAVVDDIFFASKIRAIAEHLGLEVRFEKTAAAALEAARTVVPSLIIADLHYEMCDPLALAGQLKKDAELREIPLIGFFSHVQTALQKRAQEAGFDRTLPRSAFTKHLAEILQGQW